MKLLYHLSSVPLYKKIAYLLTIILVLLALFCIIIIFLFSKNSSSAKTAEIYQNGILIKSIPLSESEKNTSYTFTLTNAYGGTNTIEVRSDSIGIISANCPDKLCVHQGFITSSSLPITCLPNRLVIQIREKASPDSPSLDSIVH